jgi:hypothetical protein
MDELLAPTRPKATISSRMEAERSPRAATRPLSESGRAAPNTDRLSEPPEIEAKKELNAI